MSDCEERFCRLKYQFTIIKDHTKVRQGDLEVAKRENLAFKSLVMDHAKVIYEWEAKVSQLEEEGAILPKWRDKRLSCRHIGSSNPQALF